MSRRERRADWRNAKKKMLEFAKGQRAAEELPEPSTIFGETDEEQDQIMKVVAPLVRQRSGDRCEFVAGGFRCVAIATEMHHRKQRSHGTDNRLINILHLCQHHHHWVEHNKAVAYREGWLVHSWDPVLPPPMELPMETPWAL